MYRFHGELSDSGAFCVQTNLNEEQIGEFSVFSIGRLDKGSADEDVINVVKHNHCIAVCQSGSKITIINDPFATIPIYIYVDGGDFVVESVFEKFKGKKLTADTTGCYELLMYEAGLYDRTVFNEIKDLPAASTAVYSQSSGELKIYSYWDYRIDCAGEIEEQNAVKKVWKVLSESYKRYKDMSVIMGVSGGLDSRLSLCLLKQVSDCESIKTFTFGHSKKIMDYEYACNVCDQLGIERPQFFELKKDAYRDGMVLPVKSGGCLGVTHGHAWHCLNRLELRNKILVSNYYSDGVMGYDCRPTDAQKKEDCDYYRILNENKWNVPTEVIEEIRGDLDKVIGRRNPIGDNYSGYNEFIYITERNPKFHMRLSYLYSELLPVEMPFATYDLLESVISLPQPLRYYKKIERLILSEKLGDFADVSSTRYAGLDKEERTSGAKFRYNTGFIHMLFINRINSLLKLLSNGAIQLDNPYITENHLAVFDRSFAMEKHEADESLGKWINFRLQHNPLKHNSIRTIDAERGFRLLNLYFVLREYKMNP